MKPCTRHVLKYYNRSELQLLWHSLTNWIVRSFSYFSFIMTKTKKTCFCSGSMELTIQQFFDPCFWSCFPVTQALSLLSEHLPSPLYWSPPPSQPDNMDGFYDQLVPFMVPSHVSGFMPALNITFSHSQPWLCIMDGVTHVHCRSLYIALSIHPYYPLCVKWHHLLAVWQFSFPTAQISCGGNNSQQATHWQEKEICRHRTCPGHRR